MAYYTFTAQRDRDFMSECRRQHLLDKDSVYGVNYEELLEMVINQPAPSYYLSYDYVSRAIQKLRKYPERYTGRQSVRLDAIREISDKQKQCLSHLPGLTPEQALVRVLTQGDASRYFISLPTARRLFFQLRSKTRSMH